MGVKKSGNKIRYKGVYRLYRNGVLIKETQYSLLNAFDGYPSITVEELEVMTTDEIETRATAMIEAIAGECSDFEIINNVIYESGECSDEEEFMIGQIIDFAGKDGTWDTEKWLKCDGAVVNIADYPELYEVIGTAWNYSAGITDTNFQLPDLKGRVTLGYDESSSKTPRINTTQPVTANYGAVGNTGGKQFVQLTSLENGKHSHSTELFSRNGWPNDSADRTNNYYWISKEVDPAGATKGLAIDDSGNGNPHENRQPYAVVYKLIRYK